MGGYTTRFDALAFAAFDLYMLKRGKAEEEWGEDASRAACEYFKQLSSAEADSLRQTILHGLPGGHRRLTIEETAEMLQSYAGVSRDELRCSLGEFLRIGRLRWRKSAV